MKYFLYLVMFLGSLNVSSQNIKIIAKDLMADIENGVQLNNVAYFSGNDQLNGWEFWRSDGTEAGTYMVLDIRPGTRNDSSRPDNFFTYGNKVYFTALTPSSSSRVNVYESDGSKEGTKIIIENIENTGITYFDRNNSLCVGYLNGVFERKEGKYDKILKFGILNDEENVSIYTYNNDFYYLLYNQWKSKKGYTLVQFNPNTKEVKEIRDFYNIYNSSNKRGTLNTITGNMVCIGNNIVFAADDGNYGIEPWISDGTQEGTKMLVDLNSKGESSYPFFFVANDQVFCNANTYLDALKSTRKLAYKIDPLKKGVSSYIQYKNRAINSIQNLTHLDGDRLSLTFNVYYDITSYSNYLPSQEYRVSAFLDLNDVTFNFQENDLYLPSTAQKYQNSFYYFGTSTLINICDFTLINSFEKGSNSKNVAYTILSEYFEIERYEPNLDNRRVKSFLILDNILIASKNNYESSSYKGIYTVTKCNSSSRIQNKLINPSYCINTDLTFKSDVNATSKVFWEYGGLSCISLGTGSSINFKPETSGNLTLISKDESGCYTSDQQSISIYENNLRAEIIGDQYKICPNDTLLLRAATLGGSPPLKYFWLSDTTLIGNTKTNTFGITQPGSYSVIVQDSIGCAIRSNATSISSNGANITTITSSSTNNLLKPNETLSLSIVQESGITYQWYKGNVAIVGENKSTFFVKEPGEYKVEIKSSTCAPTFSNSIKVDLITSYNPSTETIVYPNPSEGIIHINGEQIPVDIEIYDLAGTIIDQYKNYNHQVLNISSLESGKYILYIKKNKQQTIHSIIKY